MCRLIILQGFNLTSAGSQDFTITHFWFVLVGKSLPAWFCVEGAFNPITVTVSIFIRVQREQIPACIILHLIVPDKIHRLIVAILQQFN